MTAARCRVAPDAERRRAQPPQRFIAAYGRDVDVPESSLVFDSLTQHLSIETGSRVEVAKREALAAIVAVLATDEPLSGRGLKAALEGEHPRLRRGAPPRLGLRLGRLDTEHGPRNAKLYKRIQA